MRRFVLLWIAMLVWSPSILLAQTPKEGGKETKEQARPAVQPVPSSPEKTTASFGDWVYKCEVLAATGKRACEIGQAMTVQGQSAPIAQIALARASRSDPMRLVLVLPTNVTLTSAPKIFLETDDKSPLQLNWERCVPGGCIAGVVVTDEMMTKFAARQEPGIIAFRDATERDFAIPLSFRGLAQATAAAAKEPQ